MNMGFTFREDKMALNVGAIRTTNSQSNKFDDFGFVAFVNQIGEPHLFTFACTTDPGKYYLQNPLDRNGCIITVPGQYIEVFGRGLHNGNYECFKQKKHMCYVRDNNKDTILDFDLYRDSTKRKINAFWGINGTNLHRASVIKLLQWVERYSAGCTVVQSATKFKQLIELRDASVNYGYTLWDYTLFEEGLQDIYFDYQKRLIA